VRLGLGYVKGAAKAEMQALVAERERGGVFTSLGELAGRVACARTTLEQLAWSGACDSLTDGQDGRRTALWQLGLAASAEAGGYGGESAEEATQLALPLELPQAPRLRRLGRWQRLIADYSTSGVSTGEHAMTILRERLTVPMLATSAQLTRLPSGCQVAVAGLVIARQRPGTAGGTMFLLFEDEFGTINLIVPRAVYERNRALARAEPLLLARGRLERSQQPPGPDERAEDLRPVINVIVRELEPLERYLPDGLEGEVADAAAQVHYLHGAEQDGIQGEEVASSMRAVAPPVQSFAMGRRR